MVDLWSGSVSAALSVGVGGPVGAVRGESLVHHSEDGDTSQRAAEQGVHLWVLASYKSCSCGFRMLLLGYTPCPCVSKSFTLAPGVPQSAGKTRT